MNKAYTYEGQLRLVMNISQQHVVIPRRKSLSKGWLQVYLNQEWTFVCNETFGENEAMTACRQLGYTTYISYDHENYNGYM